MANYRRFVSVTTAAAVLHQGQWYDLDNVVKAAFRSDELAVHHGGESCRDLKPLEVKS